MKYKEAYEGGRQKLERAGIANADLDARLLLESICNTSRHDLLVHADRVLTQKEEKRYTEVLLQRELHIPLQHITGSQEFMGLEFAVNEQVLIPRQDTEILVEEALLRLHDGMRILDMCTGSGCIVLSLLQYSNDTYGMGADISKEALEVAKHNADQLGIQADFLQSDLFAQVEGKFDMLVSNPPYIPSKDIEGLMPEVSIHEPLFALDGGEDGLFFYRKIIKQCSAFLYGGAAVLFEIGCDQGARVKELMEQAGFIEVSIIKDYAGLDRVVTGIFLEEK